MPVVGSGSSWVIRLCGPLEVRTGDRELGESIPGRQGRLLLAYLAVNRDRACPRAELIDVLWPESPPAAADTALSALLSKLRRALGEGALTGRSEVRLTLPGDVTVDVEQAATAARRAEVALQDGDWRAAAAAAHDALAADPAAFLADCDGPWLHEQRGVLHERRVRALELLAEASLRGGELAEAADAARAALAAAPFRESAHMLLMEAHAAAGNPAEALRAFEDLRRLLREELGAVPGPSVMALHERLLHGRAHAQPAAPAPPPAIAARRWPAPLDAARGRHEFVGRAPEALVLQEAWVRVAEGARGLVVIAGEAGIGKTRLAAELAAHAHADGAVVLFGRFDEEAPAPYQPVVGMVRGWAGGASLAPLAERLGSRAAELSFVLPEFGPPPAGQDGSLRSGEADTKRLRLFDAIAALLAEIAGAAPLLVVLDDLHWADLPTLQLIGHLVRAPAPERAMFLASSRADEGSEELAALLAALRREGSLERLDLTGLDAAETGRARDRARRPAVDAVVRGRAARRHGRQPVLHRGGRAAPRGCERPPRRRDRAARGRGPRGRARGDVAPARAARRRRPRDARHRVGDRARVRLRRARAGRAAGRRRAGRPRSTKACRRTSWSRWPSASGATHSATR